MNLDYFRVLAQYNQWANRRVYDACAQLADTEYSRPRAAFFKSIHGTLNHLLVGDRVWLARIAETESGISGLDQILYDTFAALRAAREAEDLRVIATVDAMPPKRLDDDLAYRQIVQPGGMRRTPMRLVLAHMFNHQTHHRGQVHDQLTQTLIAPPSLDLIFYLRERGM